jgi:hypothetical protein
MRAVTIQLNDDQFEALETMAKENGLTAAERLVHQEIERFITSDQGPGRTPGLEQHVKTSIEENRKLLERLAHRRGSSEAQSTPRS